MQLKFDLKSVFSKVFLLRIIKFGFAGFIGLLIDFSITFLLKELLLINPYAASALGFGISAYTNFTLNRLWTFEQSNGNVLLQLSLFSGVCLIALLLNTSCIYVLVNYTGLNFYLSKFAGVFVTFLWNFTAHSLLTFNPKFNR